MLTVSRRIRTLTVVALAATGVLLMSVLPASAQEYPPGPPFSIVCPPSETPSGNIPPGLERICTLTGPPGQVFDVSYEYDGKEVDAGEFTIGDDGTVVFDLVLERDAVGRVVTVTAVGQDGEEAVTVEDSFRVAGAAEPPIDPGEPVTPEPPLARTGVDAALLVGVGVLLLGVGFVVLRRRSGRSASAGSGTHTGT